MTKPTCGPMYKEAIEKYGTTDAEAHAFAAGFVSGQAEKVYLGACRAAMFRPSQDRLAMILEIVSDVVRRYDLCYIAGVGSKNEVWICRRKWARDVQDLHYIKEDSPAWHEKRAWLCGIPGDEVDVAFHPSQRTRCPMRLNGATETDFLKQVLYLARLRNWRCAHFRPGMNKRGKWMTAVQADGAGFPDLLFLREEFCFVAELKVVGANKVTLEQDLWLRAFEESGIPAFTWTPEDWQEIERVLEKGPVG